MPALLRKFNHRNIVLTDTTEAESVGILDHVDYPRYFPWGGFINAGILAPNYVRVRLEVHAWSDGDGYFDPWTRVAQHQYVLGVRVNRLAYALLDKGRPVVK